jgi:hypothetical protein
MPQPYQPSPLPAPELRGESGGNSRGFPQMAIKRMNPSILRHVGDWFIGVHGSFLRSCLYSSMAELISDFKFEISDFKFEI